MRFPLLTTITALLLFTTAAPALAQRFPGDSFGIFPLFGKYSGSAGSLTEAQALAELLDLKAQIGENHGHFHVGFNGIYGGKPTLERNCRLAQANNMSHAVIINVQTHAGPTSIQNIAAADFRNYQWRKDGVTWEGDDMGDNRDWQVVTPSRYATTLRAQFKTLTDSKANPIKNVMDDYPGVIVSVNACIEEELATRGQADPFLADYSPYAVTEFRDWLRHTGLYDADTGTYPTEGAPATITGTHVMIGGKLRSPFYDDPTPANANGTGTSFNGTFGTGFTTWTLLNWDLSAYPAPITDVNFDPTPGSGTGHTAGGFDAPRTRVNGNAFWRAWSWDYMDQSDTYPSGNPSAPAFGFRQVMIRNFVNDVLGWIEDTGIPGNLITAHQIPGEMLSSVNRSRSSASPVWTGLSKHNGTVGITRYGNISASQVNLITQYSDDWGIYEWHPKPSETDNTVLHNRAMTQLDLFYANNCRIVCPFSWTDGAAHGTYPVNDSGFATGIKAWLDAQSTTVDASWTGGAADGNWNTANNWGGTLPTFDAALNAIFPAGTANTTTFVQGARTLNALTIDAAIPVSIRLSNSATNVSAAAARDLTFDGVTPAINIAATSTAAHTLGVAAGNVSLAQTLTVNHDGPADFLIDRAILGAGGLIKNGPGQLTLSPAASGGAGPNANQFAGGLTLNAGKLRLGADSALGAGAVSVAGLATLSSNNTEARSIANGVTLDSNITLGDATDNGALTFSGPLTLAGGNRTLTLAGSASISGPVGESGGSRSLLKDGPALLTLSGTSTFTGNVSILSGPLRIENSSALGTNSKTVFVQMGTSGQTQLLLNGSGGNIALPAAITLNTSMQSLAGALVNEAGNNTIAGPISMVGGGGNTLVTVQAGSLALNGSITANFASGRTLRLAGTGSNTVNGVIQDGSGVASVALEGGAWTLSAANTHTGATTVSGGALNLTGSLTGSVTVSGGALGGTGSVAANVTVNSGGTHAPGNSTGIMTLGGNYALNAGAALEIEIDGPSPGAQHDQVKITGAGSTVTLAGALNLIAAPGLAAGTSHTIIDKASAGAISGTFAGKPEGSAFTAGVHTWIISYAGGNGNDVTLTVATAQQAWRFEHFGTVANTGNAADGTDLNGDGENNLYEFSTAQDPEAATTATPTAILNGANIEFTYDRSLAALADGVTFTVEWSDALAPGSWSTTGVTDNDNGILQTIIATVPIAPAGTGGKRFVRLRVTAP